MVRKGAILLILAAAAGGFGSVAAEVTRGLTESPAVARASATTVPAEIVRKAIAGRLCRD